MAENSRQRQYDVLIGALARGETHSSASTLSGYCVRTVQRRLDDAEFRGEVQRVRSQMVDAAAGRISYTLDAAAECLKGLLSSPSDAIRLGAARSLFEIGIRLKEVVDLEGRMLAVEDRLNRKSASTTHPR